MHVYVCTRVFMHVRVGMCVLHLHIHTCMCIHREVGGGREGGRKVCSKAFAYATVEMQVPDLQAEDPRKSCHCNSDAKAICWWNSFLLGEGQSSCFIHVIN